MANSMEEGSSYAKENIFLTCRCLYANEIIIMKSIFCQSVGRSVGWCAGLRKNNWMHFWI